MSDEAPLDPALETRLTRFERTVATCLSFLPLLFAGQCLFITGSSRTIAKLYLGMGVKLSMPNQLLIDSRPLPFLVILALATVSIVVSRVAKPRVSVIVSSLAALVLFALAQMLLFITWVPFFEILNSLN